MGMTSKERMYAALEGRSVDRVPVAIMLDGSYLYRAARCDPREHGYSDNVTRAAIQARFWNRHPQNDLITAWYGGSREYGTTKILEREEDRFFLLDKTTGERKELRPVGRREELGRKTSELSVADPVTTVADIDRVLGPVPTPEQVLETGRQDILGAMMQQIGDEAFVTFRPGELFPPAIETLGGFERAMEMVITAPDVVGAVVEGLALRKIPFIQAGAKFKPDGAILTAFLEGPDMISPRAWRELVLPGHRIMAEEARKHGLKIVYWVLGACLEHLEDLCETGVDALLVEQSRCAYSCEPAEIRKIVGDRMCIFGWTPELAMIKDDRAEITRVVEDQMRTAGPGGPFGMSTTFLTDEVAPETVQFFCEEVVRLSDALGMGTGSES